MTRRRKFVLSLVTTAAAAAVTVPIIASSAPTQPLLPDLVSDSPTGPRFDTYDPVNGTARLLVRFDGYIHNDGDGPLDIQGNPNYPSTAPNPAVTSGGSTVPAAAASPSPMGQYLWNGTGARDSTAFGPNAAAWTRVTDHPNSPNVFFDPSDTHNHFHVRRAAEYSLWNDTKTAIVAPANKVGFCQYDSQRVNFSKGPQFQVYGDTLTGDFCRQDQPNATQLREGISEGYRDIYDWTLDYQWIDVSNVAPGVYYLAGRMDPDNVFKEKDETNNGYAYSAPVTVPGYRADAVTANTAFKTPVQVTLAATGFTTTTGYGATLGPRRYRVESLPAHGIIKNGNTTLSVGSALPAGVTAVQYIPNTNFSGVDSFQFSAIDTNSNYPTQPARATASVNVGGSGASVVSLSGAPGQMVTGTQVQLAATSSTGGALVWTTTGGTVTSSGVLTAPDAVPAGGSITVRAALADDIGAFKEVVIPIVPVGTPVPQPVVPPVVTTAALSKPGVLTYGRNVTVTVQVNQGGTVVLSLSRGGTRLDACSTKAPAGQTVSCKFQLSKAFDPGTVRVNAKLTTTGGKVYTSTSTAGPSTYRKVAVRRSGRRISLVVTPQRPGFVRVVLTARGKVVGRCAGRVLPNGSLSCTRRLGPAVGSAKVRVSVTFKDLQGRTAIRELAR
ncbi:MAG: lysyl oxidase family protein [Thermoleophilia bacterium]